MKIKKMRQNGFVMIFVIVAIAVVGAEMFVLTGGSNTILFESDTAYLRAVERNLVASGLAWAEHNIKNQDIFSKTIELDVARMNIYDSALSVTVGIPQDKEAEVQIETSCSRGRQTFRGSNKYHIELER